jgi:predicted amidohydrolase
LKVKEMIMNHSGSVKVAAVQWQHRLLESFDQFASHIQRLLDLASDSQIVLFGEQFTINLLTLETNWRDLAPSDFGRVAQHTEAYRALFREEAIQRGQVILAGSHLVGDTSQNMNVAHLFLPDGSTLTHSKTHIFPVEADSGTREGDLVNVVDLGFVTIGLEICYEAEIPEISTIIARRGAEIILCPSYTITKAGFWRVRHCAQARCIENQVYFAHCSTVGHIGEPIPDGLGRSSILSPCDANFPANGVVAEATENKEDVITASLDLDLLYENRRSGAAPTFRDRLRRASLYQAHQDELLAGPLAASADLYTREK